MKPASLFCAFAFVASVLIAPVCESQAFTISLQEQGGLSGFVAGGGSLNISSIAVDHWTVTVNDSRIGTPQSPFFNLAFTEPELVSGMTAYNNIQVLSISPGTIMFDVLSDEFSPYSTIVPNNTAALFQATSADMISLKFNDLADVVPEPGIAGLFFTGAILLSFSRKSR